MTDYFILLSDDNENDAMLDTSLLGTESFKSFYPGQGMVALNNIVVKRPKLLNEITILDDKKIKYTVEEFLDILTKLTIRGESF